MPDLHQKSGPFRFRNFEGQRRDLNMRNTMRPPVVPKQIWDRIPPAAIPLMAKTYVWSRILGGLAALMLVAMVMFMLALIVGGWMLRLVGIW